MEQVVYENWAQIFDYVSAHEINVLRLRVVNKFFDRMLRRWHRQYLAPTLLPNLAIGYNVTVDQYSLYMSHSFWKYLKCVTECGSAPYWICDFTFDEEEFDVQRDYCGYVTANIPSAVCDTVYAVPFHLNKYIDCFKEAMLYLWEDYQQYTMRQSAAVKSLHRLY